MRIQKGLLNYDNNLEMVLCFCLKGCKLIVNERTERVDGVTNPVQRGEAICDTK